MSSLSLNLVAIAIFGFTMSALLGPLIHLDPIFPAIAAFGLLGLATVDTLGLDGRGSTLMLDWLAAISPEHRQRVTHHEAGHFLVAHMLEIPIADYTLTAWEAFRQGQAGRGGVRFDDRILAAQLERGTLSARSLDRYCTVWMAGIAAETLVYDNAEGGGDDRQQLRAVLSQLSPPIRDTQQRERWATLQATTLLATHRSAYDALVEAMSQRLSVTECCAIVDRHRHDSTSS
ncbi:MAG: ATP-dependent Zn protease [Cyanobacteriota bacterium]|nr:ATP-dependent Zn protease [Cyanobacteriota bacterium]